MLRLTLITLTLSAILFADSFAATWFIKPDGTGDAPTIQAGIDSAVAGDTVSLKNGTFRGDGNRDIDFLGKAIVVRSEFGEPSWCVIDCEGSPTDFHRGFHLHSGEDSTSVLEGVTITNGYLGEEDRGAGILCENSSAVTLLKCWINGNTIHQGGKGAGLYCSGASMRIDNCEFLSNRTQQHPLRGAHYGGGIYADACSLTIIGSYFGNLSGMGGGIYCQNSVLSVAQSTFSGNKARYSHPTFDSTVGSGGGIWAGNCELSLTGCLFTNNRGTDEGGGVVGNGTFVECVFENNSAVEATTGSSGGAIYGGGTFTDCEFVGNYSETIGGAIDGSGSFTRCRFVSNSSWRLFGGAVNCGDANFLDCEFVNNSSPSQGGGVCAWGTAMFENCMFAGNWGNWGGGVWAKKGTLTNCTFYDNWGVEGGAFAFHDSVYMENTISAFNTSTDTTYWSPYTATLVCCDVYGNEGGDWVGPLAGQNTINGNFSSLPMFCDPDNGDFTLASVSECLPANNGCGVLVGAYGQGCDYAVGVPDDRVVPPSQAVITAYPNPFNPSTTIEYYVPRSGEVTIRLFDVSGRLVATLIDRYEAEGFNTEGWDGTDLRGQPVSSGVYFVRLESGELVQTRKIVLLK